MVRRKVRPSPLSYFSVTGVRRRQRAAALLLPHRVLVGKADGRTGGRDPAEFGIIGLAVSDGEYSTIGGESGSTVSRNCTSARSSMRAPLQRDAADDARGLDLDARALPRSRHRGSTAGAIGRGRRCRARRAQARCRPAAACSWAKPGRSAAARSSLQLGLRLLGGALPLHLRHVVEILPGDQHEAGQDDGEDGVAVIESSIHVSSFSPLFAAASRACVCGPAGRGDAAPSGDRRAWYRNRGRARHGARPAHSHDAVASI